MGMREILHPLLHTSLNWFMQWGIRDILYTQLYYWRDYESNFKESVPSVRLMMPRELTKAERHAGRVFQLHTHFSKVWGTMSCLGYCVLDIRESLPNIELMAAFKKWMSSWKAQLFVHFFMLLDTHGSETWTVESLWLPSCHFYVCMGAAGEQGVFCSPAAGASPCWQPHDWSLRNFMPNS